MEIPNGYAVVPEFGIVPAGVYIYHHPNFGGVWKKDRTEGFTVSYPYGHGQHQVASEIKPEGREW